MDLEARKYQIIEELFSVKEPSVLEELEGVLKKERTLSDATKQVLDERLVSFEKNPKDVLDWNDVKRDW